MKDMEKLLRGRSDHSSLLHRLSYFVWPHFVFTGAYLHQYFTFSGVCESLKTFGIKNFKTGNKTC